MNPMNTKHLIILTALMAAPPAALLAAEGDKPSIKPAGTATADKPEARSGGVNYEEHIKPILRRHCLACHGEDKQEAPLNLQTYACTLKGGGGGAAVVAGRSSQSLLFKAITDPGDDARMPPN